MKYSIRKEKSVRDYDTKNAAVLSNECNLELVIGTEPGGIFEMPIIKKFSLAFRLIA